MNEAEIACGSFIVACCEAARAFEFVEAALDLVSQSVGYGIERDWHLAIGFAGNDRRSTAICYCVADMIAIIATVSQKHLGGRKVAIDQSIEAFEIRDFASRYFCPDRQSVSVGNEVDLGRKATF